MPPEDEVAISDNQYFGDAFNIAAWLKALALLAITTVLMWFVARPFGKRVRAACKIRPSGVPRVSDEELSQILHSQKTNLITLIGVAGLGTVLYLIVFKPVF